MEYKGKRVLKLGLDMHYRQVTVAMQEEDGRIKAVGKMGHEAFVSWLEKKLKEGWEVYSCYEAGASGYWLHRRLVEMGVKNLVIVPKAVSSYTGLCPGIHSSDGRGKEGSINRCGNAVVRWNLVEMVWRLLKWQPHYEPVRQFSGRLGKEQTGQETLGSKGRAPISH